MGPWQEWRVFGQTIAARSPPCPATGLAQINPTGENMNETLTTAQREELKALLLAARRDLQTQMQQNRENLAPPAADQDGTAQGNVGREVDQALTNIDTADLARIDHALEALEDGSYGLCAECGCNIPFERLKIEPQTQHCVACKSRWEQSKGHARVPS
jgi:DnaK suppressor protein